MFFYFTKIFVKIFPINKRSGIIASKLKVIVKKKQIVNISYK